MVTNIDVMVMSMGFVMISQRYFKLCGLKLLKLEAESVLHAGITYACPPVQARGQGMVSSSAILYL